MAKKKRYAAPEAMERCFSTTNGTEASFPILYSRSRKSASKSPNAMNRPMIVGDVHGRLWPPHCIAMNNDTMEEISRTLPPRSSRWRNCTVLQAASAFDRSASGNFKITTTSRNTKAPSGKLLLLVSLSYLPIAWRVLTSKNTISICHDQPMYRPVPVRYRY